MKKKVTEFTEKEKDLFCEHFYMIEDLGINDIECSDISAPWGCPWHFSDETLEGDTIEVMAENYFKSVRDEILRLLKENEEQQQ